MYIFFLLLFYKPNQCLPVVLSKFNQCLFLFKPSRCLLIYTCQNPINLYLYILVKTQAIFSYCEKSNQCLTFLFLSKTNQSLLFSFLCKPNQRLPFLLFVKGCIFCVRIYYSACGFIWCVIDPNRQDTYCLWFVPDVECMVATFMTENNFLKFINPLATPLDLATQFIYMWNALANDRLRWAFFQKWNCFLEDVVKF